jgi:hypothetical protein
LLQERNRLQHHLGITKTNNRGSLSLIQQIAQGLTCIILRIIFVENTRGIFMSTKLTLQMDEQVIESAKVFARNNHVSLSKLAENYFKMLTQREGNQAARIPGVVGELAGILGDKEVDFSKDSYVDYLEEKYS